MITFAGQLDGFRISKIGDRVLSIRTYDQYAEDVSKVINEPMGSEFIVIMIPTKDKESVKQWQEETPEETKERFRRRMNALVNEYAELLNEDAKEVRTQIKVELQKQGIISESTKELDIAGYSEVIVFLKNKIYERKKKSRTR